jgi:hypothetical protein
VSRELVLVMLLLGIVFGAMTPSLRRANRIFWIRRDLEKLRRDTHEITRMCS